MLKPIIEDDLGRSEIDYGRIVLAFQPTYAVGLLVVGRLLDRVGTRLGMAIAITLWSLAAMFHGVARTVLAFMLARIALGLAESAAYPGAVKAVAEWFPRRERALATGIFNYGSNIGAIVAPRMVPIVAVTWGLPAAFLLTRALRLNRLAVGLLCYGAPGQQPAL